MWVQFWRGSLQSPTAMHRGESGMPASVRSGSAALGQVLHGQRRESASTSTTRSPSWRSRTWK